jgi:hypothetical protein
MNAESHPPHERRRSNGKANQLSDAEKFLLWRELQSIQAELTNEGPSVADVAARMSRCLSFPVTVSNIESAIDAGVVNWTPREVEERRDRLGQSLGLPQMRSTLESLGARLTCVEDEAQDDADALEGVREQVEALAGDVATLASRVAMIEGRLEAIESVLTAPSKDLAALPDKSSTQAAPAPPAKPIPSRRSPLPAPFAAALAEPVKPLSPALFQSVSAEQTWRCGSYHATAALCVNRAGIMLWAVLLQHSEGTGAMTHSKRKIVERVLNKAGRIVKRILRRVGSGEIGLEQGFSGASAVGFRPMAESEIALARSDTLQAALEQTQAGRKGA